MLCKVTHCAGHMNVTHRVRIFALGIYLFCVTLQLGSVVPRQSHLQRRKEICDYILTDIKRIYPSKVNHGYYLLLSCCSVTVSWCISLQFCLFINTDASLQLFGSSANGFGSFKSDLDICMTLDRDTDVRIVTLTCSKLCTKQVQLH